MRPSLPCLLSPLAGLLLAVTAHSAQVLITANSVDDANGTTIAAVASSAFAEIGTIHTTLTAPTPWATYRFTHWTNSANPAAVVRDPWGRSLNPLSFTVEAAATLIAHYQPASRDFDTDGVPDWWEIEHFGTLTHSATSDTDGDGISLLAESTGGTSPIYADSQLEGGVASADSALVTCNLAGYASYILRSEPAGTVDQSGTVAPGTLVNVPDLAANASFAGWLLDGVRQQDAWGRALSTFSFTMGSTNREAVAWLLTGDSDGDGVADAFEQRYYGTLSHTGSSDTDGDGISLLAESTGGTSPIYANTQQEGGVTWVDSGLVTCNLAGYPSYTLRSEPAGAVNQSAVVAPGTAVSVPDLAANPNFGWWSLDGTRQQDAWGRALSTFSFTMASTDREAVAWLPAGDSDGDGVADAFEQRYYGTLSYSGTSDTDGDGIGLVAESTGGSSPIYADSQQEGGVAWIDSSLVTCDLQAEIAVTIGPEAIIADGESAYLGLTGTGTPRFLAFTIRNPGGRPLTGLTISKDGAEAGDFSISASPVAPVNHDGQTTFTVELMSGSAGFKNAAIHIASNDVDENPFDILLNAEVVTGNWAYLLWTEDNGLIGDDADPLATPWQDGVVNLLKYACNMNGAAADSHGLTTGTGDSGLPTFRYVGNGESGGLRFEFLRRRGSGLVYVPQTNPSLQPRSWSEVTNLIEVEPINAGWERVIYEQTSVPPLPRLFGRVAVSLNDPQ